MEASAFQTVEVMQAMQEDCNHNMNITSLRVDGGMTANSLLMQFLSDLLQVKVVKPLVAETTALGAAFMAGLGVGLWHNLEDLQSLWQSDKNWAPDMEIEDKNRLVGCSDVVLFSFNSVH